MLKASHRIYYTVCAQNKVRWNNASFCGIAEVKLKTRHVIPRYSGPFLLERIGTRGGSGIPGASTMTALGCQYIYLRFSDGLCDGHNSPANPMDRRLCRLRGVFDWQILSSWPEPRWLNTSSYGCHLLECQWMIIRSWLKYMTLTGTGCQNQDVKTESCDLLHRRVNGPRVPNSLDHCLGAKTIYSYIIISISLTFLYHEYIAMTFCFLKWRVATHMNM